MVLPVTLLYGGLTGLLVVVLGIAVDRRRGTEEAGPAGPGSPDLARRLRASGDAGWAPLGLVLLGVVEAAGGAEANAIHAAGGTFFLARLLDGVGTYRRSPALERAGAVLGALVLTALALWAIALRFTRHGPFGP